MPTAGIFATRVVFEAAGGTDILIDGAAGIMVMASPADHGDTGGLFQRTLPA